MSKKQDLKAAKVRGWVDGHISAGRRLTCISCGRLFLEPDFTARLFACGCCAYAFTKAEKKLDRRMAKGDRVVAIKTAKAGTIEGFVKSDEGVVRAAVRLVGDHELSYMTRDQIEKVQQLEVKHDPYCRHGRRFPKDGIKRRKRGGDEDDDERTQESQRAEDSHMEREDAD